MLRKPVDQLPVLNPAVHFKVDALYQYLAYPSYIHTTTRVDLSSVLLKNHHQVAKFKHSTFSVTTRPPPIILALLLLFLSELLLMIHLLFLKLSLPFYPSATMYL